MNKKIKMLKKQLKKFEEMSFCELCKMIEEELEPEEYRYIMIKLLNYELKEEGGNNE